MDLRRMKMTDEQILELADKYFDYQGGWIAYSKEDLLKFAKAMYDKGRDDEAELYVDENY